MQYRVEIAPTAEAEIEAVFQHIHADSPTNADRWRNELSDIFEHLELFPEGCGLAPENDRVDFEVRQTFHGIYRVLFTIIDDRVVILHFRHGARRPLVSQRIARPSS
jgi:plasmid stabilization system protein ParE